jgi:Terpene cyclase DEP1
VNQKNMYSFLGVLGAVLPYWQFIPWIVGHGPHIGLLIRQLFANRISAFFGLDVLVSAVVLLRFIRVEGRRSGVRLLWLPIAGVFAIGVSFGLPMFLYLRERALEGLPGAVEGAPTAGSCWNRVISSFLVQEKGARTRSGRLELGNLAVQVLLPFFRPLFLVLLALFLHSNFLLRFSG